MIGYDYILQYNHLITGMFYLTIPNASLFLRTLNDGLRHVKSLIKKSKFHEIQLTELLLKEGKKTSKLGMTYYCLHLIGLESVRVVSTTTGPLLKYVDDDWMKLDSIHIWKRKSSKLVLESCDVLNFSRGFPFIDVNFYYCIM